MTNNNNLVYVCSLIEYIARQTQNDRNDIVRQLGADVRQIYDKADMYRNESIAKVAEDFVKKNHIAGGEYDNISSCESFVPEYEDIGQVFARLIEDCRGEKDVIDSLNEVYGSWITEKILDFDSDFYYQPRDYIAECYREGEILWG